MTIVDHFVSCQWLCLTHHPIDRKKTKKNFYSPWRASAEDWGLASPGVWGPQVGWSVFPKFPAKHVYNRGAFAF